MTDVWMYAIPAVIPVAVLVVATTCLPSHRLVFIVLNAPALFLSFFFSIFFPPLPVLCAFIVPLLAMLSRRALVVFVYMLVGLLNGALVHTVFHSFFATDTFTPLTLAGAAAALYIGLRHTRGMPPRHFRRPIVCSVLGVLGLIFIVFLANIYSTPIANRAALLNSPAFSGFLLRLGAIAGDTVEDTLFLQAKALGKQETLLRDMLLARERKPYRYGKQQSHLTIIHKLSKEYNSPELLPIALDLLQAKSLPDSEETLWQLITGLDIHKEQQLLHELEQRGLFSAAMKGPRGVSVLAELVRFKRIPLIQRLIAHTPAEELQKIVMQEDDEGINPLAKAVLSDAPEPFHLLLPYADSLFVKDSRDRSFVHIAAMGNSPTMLPWLLEQAESNPQAPPGWINSTDTAGASPLHYAALGSYASGMRLLAHHGGTVDALDNQGQSPLMTALGLRAKQVPHLGGLPVHLVPGQKDTKDFALQSLLALPAINVNNKDADGRTPMHYAGLLPQIVLEPDPVYLDMLHTLVNLGANPALKDAQGRTALELFQSSIKQNIPKPRHAGISAVAALKKLMDEAQP